MRWLLALILLLSPLAGLAATGDVKWADTDGVRFRICFEGMATNGVGYPNLTITNSVTRRSFSENLRIPITSMGYSGGTATTVQWTNLGTTRFRFAYPGQSFVDAVVSGSDVIVSFAMQNHICQKDSNILAVVSAGLYAAAGVSNNAGTVSVTNNSVLQYTKARGVWRADQGWNRETNSTMTVAAMGVHGSATNGRPLDVCRFIYTGSGIAITQNVSALSIDWSLAETLPSAVYYGSVNLSAFTNLDEIRVDCHLIPRIGDSDAVFALPSITNRCDRLNVLSNRVAVVDYVLGDDALGRVTNVAPALVATAHYFKTDSKAWHAIRTNNNTLFGIDAVDGGIVYKRANATNFVSGSGWTFGDVPKSMAIIRPFPGDTVEINNDSGPDDISDRVQIEDIYLRVTNPVVPFNGIQRFRLVRCILDSPGTALIQASSGSSIVDLVSCRVTNFAQGLKGTVGQNVRFNAWNCNLDGFNNQIIFGSFIGVYHPSTNGGNYSIDDGFIGEGVSQDSNDQMIYNCFFGGYKDTGTLLEMGTTHGITNGIAVLQSVFLLASNVAGQVVFYGTDNDKNYTNMIFAGNVISGQRIGIGYRDETGTGYRAQWTYRDNVSSELGIKGDLLSPFDGARYTGYAPVGYGMGFQHNMRPEISPDWNANGLLTNLMFFGVDSYSELASGGNPPGWLQFVDDESNLGTNQPAPRGGGSYRFKTNSPAVGLSGDFMLAYDIEGNPRSASDPPGPYAAVGVRYCVATNGNDLNDGTSWLFPWRTIAKAAATMVAGDTVQIKPGFYNEYVTTGAHGDTNNVITYHAMAPGVVTKQFRVSHQWQVIDGIEFVAPSDENATTPNLAAVRIETAGSYAVVTNNTFRDWAWAKDTNVNFVAASNAVIFGTANLLASNFVAGSHIYMGSDSTRFPTNHNSAWRIKELSADGKTVWLTNSTASAFTNELGSNFWVVINAGANAASGYPAIQMVIGSGITGPTNCVIVNNLFSNVFGVGIHTAGSGHRMESNTFTEMCSYPILVGRTGSRNLTFRYNLLFNSPNIIHYTNAELGDTNLHPPGATLYDYDVGLLHFQGDTMTNNLIERNWLEGAEQQLGYATHMEANNNGFIIRSNVFIGFSKAFSGSMDGMTIDRNTFYRISYDASTVLGLGGNEGHIQDGLNVRSNVFVDGGQHVTPTNEGWYTIVDAINTNITGNFVAGAESLGFAGKNANNITYNGGDPMFVNASDPLGADGLPFTDDDGLKPLPGSTIATHGLGALNPVPLEQTGHFRMISPLGWHDETGTNFNLAWAALPPGWRNSVIRPWTTPDALGHIPVTATFCATGAISGLTSVTNWYGIRTYGWTFGDGASALTVAPYVSHTYCTTGEMTVTLWITNFAGATASFTNVYRTLPQTNAVAIIHVKTNGNDTTGNGSFSLPYLTIDKAVNVMAAGDYIAVHQGSYGEVVDVDRNVASAGSRISFISLGARTTGWNIRFPYFTVEGFDVDGVGNTSTGPFFIYVAADELGLYNNIVRGATNTASFYFDVPPSVFPTDGQLNCSLSNNVVNGCKGVAINLQGSNHLVGPHWIGHCTGEADVVRIAGSNHRIYGLFATNMQSGAGGHPDVFQTVGDFGYWAKDNVIENSTFISGTIGDATNWAICQLEQNVAGGYTNFTSMSNNIVRNCQFVNFGQFGSVDTDGMKFYNNLFYRCATNGGMVFAWGGDKGSASNSIVQNNIFYECGIGAGQSTNQGWYQSGREAWGTNVSLVADYNFVAVANNGAVDQAPPDAVDHWASYGFESNGINGGNPLFVNVAIHDFRLSTGSPLLDEGATISGFSTDMLGNPRVAPWDIGPLDGSTAAAPPDGGGSIIYCGHANVGTIIKAP